MDQFFQMQDLGAIAPELHATWIEFANEDTLWVAGWRDAGCFSGRLSLDGSGSYDELAGGAATFGPRYAPAIAVSADGSRAAAAYESADEPPEVVLWENGERRTLTSLNAEIGPQLAWRQELLVRMSGHGWPGERLSSR